MPHPRFKCFCMPFLWALYVYTQMRVSRQACALWHEKYQTCSSPGQDAKQFPQHGSKYAVLAVQAESDHPGCEVSSDGRSMLANATNLWLPGNLTDSQLLEQLQVGCAYAR